MGSYPYAAYLSDYIAKRRWGLFVTELLRASNASKTQTMWQMAWRSIVPPSALHAAASPERAPWLDWRKVGPIVQPAPRWRREPKKSRPSQRYLVSELHAFLGLLAVPELRMVGGVDVSYPFLDRRLIEFVLGIPWEQRIYRAQTRRLQREGLAGIVPGEVLGRRTKNSITGLLQWQVANRWSEVERICGAKSKLAETGLIDWKLALSYAERVRRGTIVPSGEFIRLLAAESWLRQWSSREGSVEDECA